MALSDQDRRAFQRDPRSYRQDHFDTLIQRFGDGRIFRRQMDDLPYLDGERHARVRHHMLAAFHGIDLPALVVLS